MVSLRSWSCKMYIFTFFHNVFSQFFAHMFVLFDIRLSGLFNLLLLYANYNHISDMPSRWMLGCWSVLIAEPQKGQVKRRRRARRMLGLVESATCAKLALKIVIGKMRPPSANIDIYTTCTGLPKW